MPRVLQVAVLAVVIAVVAWALWPATTWPAAFCAPVDRVVGTDATAIARSFGRPEPTLTVTQEDQVNKLTYDLTLAAGHAPTDQLSTELYEYLAELGGVLSTTIVDDAVSQFDEHARTQLRACGITPIGS
jgi:hypothetical protein